ncbi:MAG TPA: acetyl-CoA carboxylase biotin carboxyl carrier protein subunit [Gemmatimonadota bacterium]|nr:acetyl-CoA carboxylase biotin carboxyl carrier protein subunit [Gemmatimonadota bacterium]
MTSPATYCVTAAGRTDPYRVVLTPSAEGWAAAVQRGHEAWTFSIREAGGNGRAWVGARLVVFEWNDGRLSLGGVEHPLTVESEARHRAARLRAAGPVAGRAQDVRAPMPGLIVAVEVEEGDRVEAGAGLVVIEAMKMENEIVAPAGGKVTAIGVRPGQAVERDAMICTIEQGEPA